MQEHRAKRDFYDIKLMHIGDSSAGVKLSFIHNVLHFVTTSH